MAWFDGPRNARAVPNTTTPGVDGVRRGGARPRDDEEGHEAQRDDEVTQRHDALAVEAVGDGAGDEAQPHGGRELGEAHVAEVELAVREVVDLPAHGHGGDLGAHGREKARELKANVVAVREDGVRSVRGGRGQRLT